MILPHDILHYKKVLNLIDLTAELAGWSPPRTPEEYLAWLKSEYEVQDSLSPLQEVEGIHKETRYWMRALIELFESNNVSPAPLPWDKENN
jgi:hypothetical protein